MAGEKSEDTSRHCFECPTVKSHGSRNNYSTEKAAELGICGLRSEAVGKSLLQRTAEGEEKNRISGLLCVVEMDSGVRQMSADKNTVTVRTSAEGKQLFRAAELSLSLQNRKGTCKHTFQPFAAAISEIFVHAKFHRQQHRLSVLKMGAKLGLWKQAT